ncbi:hypothetical protein CTAYLR_003828 [Chrysophaeum taylorii]|uniref:TraB family protein n=1 Tax=Chrysophaeum taylorii TaxID=2483200 RepID=A0AAD7UDM4_9STRA|nr:hypothetical protein CTAYLR_003828 [Chrysophaeum taylorii]
MINCLKAVDVDGDADVDIAYVAQEDNELGWFEAPSWIRRRIFVFAGQKKKMPKKLHAVLAQDLDGDSRADFLLLDNYLPPSFLDRPPLETRRHAGARDACAADIDGDAVLDVVVAFKFADEVLWYDGRGAQPHTVCSKCRFACSVACVDVDGDQDIDVVVAEKAANRISAFVNPGWDRIEVAAVAEPDVVKPLGPHHLAFASRGDEEISHLTNGWSDVYIVGTAHVSNASAQVVASTIDRVQPDLIAVELDAKRLARATTKPRGVGGFVLSLVLRALYRAFDILGYNSGAEFQVALDKARNYRIPVLLADRDIDVTFQRVSEALKAIDPAKLDEIETPFFVEDSLTASIELMKTRQNVRAIVGQLKDLAPELYEAILVERDDVIASNLIAAINDARPRAVVAVVGMAHEDGIEARLKKKGFREVFTSTPPPVVVGASPPPPPGTPLVLVPPRVSS